MEQKIKTIGLLTSGGDAPGMNAAIRAVTRMAAHNDWYVIGIESGYQGLLDKKFIPLNSYNVRGIIQRGGTILLSARCPSFKTQEGLNLAVKNLKEANIDALVVIGGDGTFRGANDLAQLCDIPIVGIPATIDNDIYGTDYTIGYDTCLNTVVEAVDKIRDTASSHNRLFFVEVMGHEAGFVAINSGLACGAEIILVPEQKNQMDKVRSFLAERAKSNKSNLIFVAEGVEGGAMAIADKLKDEFPQVSIRVTVLGHIQRGGSPTSKDRIAASEFGVAAVHALMEGKSGVMVGYENGKIHYEPLKNAVKMHRQVDPDFIKTAESIGTFTPLD
ncbi:MAG: 6-phosphofructokinase [Bacteroidales bacterium]|nr:6-phosphofructokinase [Bacteroidales bacterium]